MSPDGDSRYFVSWRGRVLLTARDQLRLATAEESGGEDAPFSKQSVHEDEVTKSIDLSGHQPVPEAPERPEAAAVKEVVFRQRKTIKYREIKEAKEGTIRDRPLVTFNLPPMTHFMQRKALADAKRKLGLIAPGRPFAMEMNEAYEW